MTKYIFRIDGMRCGMCEAHVNDAVRKAVEIESVKSSHARGETIVIAENAEAEREIVAAIEGQGYRVLSATSDPYKKRRLFSRFRR